MIQRFHPGPIGSRRSIGGMFGLATTSAVLTYDAHFPLHPSAKILAPDAPVSDYRKPDDAVLIDLLTQWAPDKRLRRRILVDNLVVLYGFA